MVERVSMSKCYKIILRKNIKNKLGIIGQAINYIYFHNSYLYL